MIQIPFYLCELIFTLIWFGVRAILWIVRRRFDRRQELLMQLMYVNIAVIIRFVFFPMERVDGRVQPLVFDPGAMFPPKVNLIPFNNLFDYESPRKTALNLIGNICMFIPTGVILPIIYKRLDRFWKVLITGALISLCIEIMQLPLNVRTSDVNDLILNTSGVVLGYLIYAAVRAIVRRRRARKESKQSTAENG